MSRLKRAWLSALLAITLLAATAGMTLLASVLFGIVPALRLSSVTAGDALKQSSGSTVAGRRRSRPLASALIALEVAIATFALIFTLLYARATSNYFAIPFGFESEHVITFRLDAPDYKYAEPFEAARVLTAGGRGYDDFFLSTLR